MDKSLIQLLGNQAMWKVIRGLLNPFGPKHIRDIAAQYSLSLAGVSDILRRLTEEGLVEEYVDKNKRCFTLLLNNEEALCLQEFFKLHQVASLRKRAQSFNTTAIKKLQWMDKAFVDSRKIRKCKV